MREGKEKIIAFLVYKSTLPYQNVIPYLDSLTEQYNEVEK